MKLYKKNLFLSTETFFVKLSIYNTIHLYGGSFMSFIEFIKRVGDKW